MKQKTSNEEAIIIAQTLRKWFNVFLPDVRSASDHTIRAYHDTMENLIHFLEEEKGIKPKSFNGECFSPSLITEWIKWMKSKKKCSNSTCNLRLSCIRSFLNYLGQQDSRFVFTQMDVQKVKNLRAPNNTEIVFSQSALESFFKAIDISTKIGKRDYALFFLMYSTGARINEVLSLRFCDIHMDLPVDQKYLCFLGKGDKRRNPPVIPEVAIVLEGYLSKLKNRKPEDLIFASSHGVNQKLSQEAVNSRLKMYAQKAHETDPQVPTDIHCHVLRHARATHWLEEGLSLPTIQKLMGHEDIRTTMRYVYVSPQQKAMALATLEDETQKNISKKWKDENNKKTLKDFLGF